MIMTRSDDDEIGFPSHMIAVCIFLVFEYWRPLKVDPNANKFQFKSLSKTGNILCSGYFQTLILLNQHVWCVQLSYSIGYFQQFQKRSESEKNMSGNGQKLNTQMCFIVLFKVECE